MKFTISTQALNSLISKIQNVVPQKPTLPILSNFLIEAIQDELILTSTDLTVGIRCCVAAKIAEEGATTLPARRLAQLLREMTVAHLEISSNPQEMTTLVAGSSRFKLHGMAKSDFPLLPNLTEARFFHLPQKELKDLLYRTAFAVSKEDNRYVLTGVLMQMMEGEVLFIGTDGKRLARAYTSISLPSSFASQSIIPLKAVEEIQKNLREEGEAKISLMQDKIAVEANDTLLVTKLLTGDYPDVNRVIPETTEIAVSLHRDELMTLLRQISLFAADQNHSVRFIFTPGELHLTANTTSIGEGQVGMPANYQGPRLEIAFNPGFFLDILRHCKEETITLGLTDGYNPGIITDGTHTDKRTRFSPLFVIMPMRLSEE